MATLRLSHGLTLRRGKPKAGSAVGEPLHAVPGTREMLSGLFPPAPRQASPPASLTSWGCCGCLISQQHPRSQALGGPSHARLCPPRSRACPATYRENKQTLGLISRPVLNYAFRERTRQMQATGLRTSISPESTLFSPLSHPFKHYVSSGVRKEREAGR